MRALVLDGDTRAALAIARSLGKRGIEVIVASDDEASLAGCSRWCAKRAVYPCPRLFPGEFAEWLVSTLSSERDVILYTASDVTISIVNRWREYLPQAAQSMLPPCQSIEVALDKSATIDLAAGLGVPVPRSLAVNHGQQIDPNEWSYPVAVKSAQSDAPYRPETAFPRNARELDIALADAFCESSRVLVQEVVPGEGTAIFALYSKGRPLATFAHRRVIEKPQWGGVSVVCESVEPDPSTLSSALRLLGELQWNGVAMVEFKVSAHGVPYLMEINPRYWGSLQLAIRAGIDFPYLAFGVAQGGTPRVDAPRHATNRWVIGEIDSLATSLLHRTPGRSRIHDLLSHILTFGNGLCCEVERLSDPRPALYEYKAWLKTSAARIAYRGRGGRADCQKLTVPGE